MTTIGQEPSLACNYCGLPLQRASDADRPRYCCFGCRFAESITAADGDEGQARFTMVRLGLAIFCSMNVMVFTMLLWSQPVESVDRLAAAWYDLARYACLVFTLAVVFLLGGPLAVDAAIELRRGRPSMSLLLCTGVAAALLYSLWSLAVRRGHVYFEVASTILVAVTLGRWLEATGKLKTTAALRGLKQLLPDHVRRIRDGHEQLIEASELAVRDEFRVLPGERIAADGQVTRHQAAVDEQAVTGESLPVTRCPGERVMGGTLVLDGPLDIRALAPVGEGTLARMIEAVAQATAARTRFDRLVERVTRWFLPVIAVAAVSTFAFHAWFGSAVGGLSAALAVLVIACPCALGLATPMALWVAVGRAAQAGVLLRDADALALLAKAKTICFDKTGTLTTGDAIVQELHSERISDELAILGVADALSRLSNHPLAAAVGRYTAARRVGQPSVQAENVMVLAGRGITGRIDAASAFLGSRAWLSDRGQKMPAQWLQSRLFDDDGAETLVAWDGRVRGRFVLSEDLRPEAATTMARLSAEGLDCVMLTGDRKRRADALAQTLNLRCRAELLPEDKLSAVRAFQAAGPVVMVGDGVNDAPALAAADVGVALGSGTDISRHSAGVCLIGNDLARLPWLVRLARKTEQSIRWNLVWAFAYNVIGVGLASAGWLHPIVAAIAMGLSSLLVVSNSLSIAQFE